MECARSSSSATSFSPTLTFGATMRRGLYFRVIDGSRKERGAPGMSFLRQRIGATTDVCVVGATPLARAFARCFISCFSYSASVLMNRDSEETSFFAHMSCMTLRAWLSVEEVGWEGGDEREVRSGSGTSTTDEFTHRRM